LQSNCQVQPTEENFFKAKYGPGKESFNALKKHLKPEKTTSIKMRKAESKHLLSSEVNLTTRNDKGEQQAVPAYFF
jgi:hypothetical protein